MRSVADNAGSFRRLTPLRPASFDDCRHSDQRQRGHADAAIASIWLKLQLELDLLTDDQTFFHEVLRQRLIFEGSQSGTPLTSAGLIPLTAAPFV